MTYNGSTQTGVATGTGYSLSNNTGIDASSYTATATLSDTTNTQWSDGTTAAKSISWSIAKKNVSVSWSKTYLAYTGSAQAPTASATGVPGETLNFTVSGKGTNAGKYTATASLTSVSGGQKKTTNYTLTGTTKDFYITIINEISTIYTNKTAKMVGVSGTNMGTLSVTSANTGIATATVSGTTLTVTGVAQGSTTLTLTEANGNYKRTVNVVIDLTGPTLTSVIANIDSSNNLTLTVNGVSDNGGIGIERYWVRDQDGNNLMYTTSNPVRYTSSTWWYKNDLSIRVEDKLGNFSTAVGISYYTVSTADGLKGLVASLNNGGDFSGRTVYQIANIDMNSTSTGSYANTTFAGTYIGKYNNNQYSISKLVSTGGGTGLFGKNTGTIQDLNLITVSTTTNAPNGAVAGTNSTTGKIIRCVLGGDVNFNADSTNTITSISGEGGGIVGHNSGEITDCKVMGTAFKSTNTSNSYPMGGISGYNDGTITNCIVSTIKHDGKSSYVGGIAGKNSGTITKCTLNHYNNIIGTSDSGGIVGYNQRNNN